MAVQHGRPERVDPRKDVIADSSLAVVSIRHPKPVREIPQMVASPPRSFQSRLFVSCRSDLHNEGSTEAESIQMTEKLRPVDVAIARRQVVIVLSAVVAGMDHPKVAG